MFHGLLAESSHQYLGMSWHFVCRTHFFDDGNRIVAAGVSLCVPEQFLPVAAGPPKRWVDYRVLDPNISGLIFAEVWISHARYWAARGIAPLQTCIPPGCECCQRARAGPQFPTRECQSCLWAGKTRKTHEWNIFIH